MSSQSEIEFAAADRAQARSARWNLGFWSLIVTQFQGAFNDNALKFLVIYIIVDMGLPGRQARLARAGGRRAVFSSLHSLLYDRRLPG